MGKGSAASAAANLRVSYHHIHLALLVGICGGVPFSSSSSDSAFPKQRISYLTAGVQDDTVILESHRERDLALFVRRIGAGDDQFERNRYKGFMWRDGDGTGAWFFNFRSSEDLEIIWWVRQFNLL